MAGTDIDRKAGVAKAVRSLSRRMATRDRGWLGVNHVRVFGPFRDVNAARLRAALIRLHAAQPATPAVCRLDSASARWAQMSTAAFTAFGPALVEEIDAGNADPAAAVAARLIDVELGDRTLVLVTCDGFIGAKIAHAVGDGRVINVLIPELIRSAAADRAPQLPDVQSSRMPVARALARAFGARPLRLLRALRFGRPPGAHPGDATVGWRPDVGYAWGRSSRAIGDVRAFRNRHLPGVSVAAVLFAAVASAFDECGLERRWPGAVIMVDARRYLPPSIAVSGNFAWGQYVRPTDLTDPKAVHHALVQQLDSAAPLLMIALRTGRLALAPGQRRSSPTVVASQPRPELTITHIGRLDAYADLPWAASPEQRSNFSVPTTHGPAAITISISELAGTMYLSASYHRSTFAPDVIQRVMDLVCADPVGLVTRR